MKTLCIIPARGGSKRIPRKNIKLFYGKPILDYVLFEAKESNCFNEIVVSTDDTDIAAIASSHQVLEHLRSEQNAGDEAVLADVIKEVILAFYHNEYDYICTLLPTAVLVSKEHIFAAFQTIIERKNIEEVMSVARFGYPIERAVDMSSDGFITLRQPEHLNSLSNNLPPAYHDAGQFYWMRTASFMQQQKIILDKTIGYELLESETQDIDTDEDWLLAEIKYNHCLQKQKAMRHDG